MLLNALVFGDMVRTEDNSKTELFPLLENKTGYEQIIWDNISFGYLQKNWNICIC